jgi:hypothetical protein
MLLGFYAIPDNFEFAHMEYQRSYTEILIIGFQRNYLIRPPGLHSIVADKYPISAMSLQIFLLRLYYLASNAHSENGCM